MREGRRTFSGRAIVFRALGSFSSACFFRVRCATRDARTSRASSQTFSPECAARSSGEQATGPPGGLARRTRVNSAGIRSSGGSRGNDGLFEAAGADGERKGGVGRRSRRALCVRRSSARLFAFERGGNDRLVARSMPVLRPDGFPPQSVCRRSPLMILFFLVLCFAVLYAGRAVVGRCERRRQQQQHELQRVVELERLKTFKLMLEKEQQFVEKKRTELGRGYNPSVAVELASAEKRVRELQQKYNQMANHLGSPHSDSQTAVS